jgi:hypothetical protein
MQQMGARVANLTPQDWANLALSMQSGGGGQPMGGGGGSPNAGIMANPRPAAAPGSVLSSPRAGVARIEPATWLDMSENMDRRRRRRRREEDEY